MAHLSYTVLFSVYNSKESNPWSLRCENDAPPTERLICKTSKTVPQSDRKLMYDTQDPRENTLNSSLTDWQPGVTEVATEGSYLWAEMISYLGNQIRPCCENDQLCHAGMAASFPSLEKLASKISAACPLCWERPTPYSFPDRCLFSTGRRLSGD